LAQAEVTAALTAEERVHLLEQLIEIAAGSGALARARSDKQAELDSLWSEQTP
jgi:hypothetical protein